MINIEVAALALVSFTLSSHTLNVHYESMILWSSASQHIFFNVSDETKLVMKSVTCYKDVSVHDWALQWSLCT